MNYGPAAGFGLNGRGAIDVFDPFLDTGQAKSAVIGRRRHADAVVAYRYVEPRAPAHHLHFDLRRGGVFRAVRQRFLHDTIYTRALRVGQPLEIAVDGKIDRHVIPPRELARLPGERGLETEIVEHAGPQPHRKI